MNVFAMEKVNIKKLRQIGDGNPEADFFQWLSFDVDDGNDYQGFSVYWHSKLMKDVHPIRKE